MTTALSDRVIQTKDSSIERDHAAPRVVIAGGGFGGLAAAKALRTSGAQVVLVDRENHHLFQPLLYQVATSVLSPGQIASPIRGILSNQRNTTVILGEAASVDTDRRCVFLDSPDRDEVAQLALEESKLLVELLRSPDDGPGDGGAARGQARGRSPGEQAAAEAIATRAV